MVIFMFLFIHNSFIIENKERGLIIWKLVIIVCLNYYFKGMKKTEFAKITGLTPGTLAKLSKNQTVSMDSLIKMCKTLNCTFDDIVEIVGEE